MRLTLTKQRQLDSWISLGPQIDEHDGERMAEEQQLNEWRDEDHENGAEQQHEEEVGRVRSKAALFEHPRISRQEQDVEEKREA